MAWSRSFVIHGRPVAKKNRHRVRFRGGRAFVGNDGVYLAWANSATLELVMQRGRLPAIKGPVGVDVRVYLAKGQRMDVDNALGGPFDVLQGAAVIENDSQIKAGPLPQMLRDPKRPRVEIDMWPAELRDGRWGRAV